MRCFKCGCVVPSSSNVCAECVRALEYEEEMEREEHERQERERLEREEMDEHFRRHPHG